MSPTMARQGGGVPLDQSDMRIALNIAKMPKGGFLSAAMGETEQLIEKPQGKVREPKKRGVGFPGCKKVKAAIERQPAMVYKNQTASWLPSQNGTAENPQTRWRCKGTSAPPPEPVAPPPRMPPLPRTPPVRPGDTDGNESYEIEGMPFRCVYTHCLLPNTQFFNHNAYAKNSKHDKDFIPDLLSTLSAMWKYCWHWFWRRCQPFERIWGWRRPLIERNRIFKYSHYLQLVDTLKYILTDIFICTIKVQCRD